jgi:hypothetical protein
MSCILKMNSKNKAKLYAFGYHEKMGPGGQLDFSLKVEAAMEGSTGMGGPGGINASEGCLRCVRTVLEWCHNDLRMVLK